MAEKRVGYKEPASYFNAAMKKAVKEYEAKKAAEEKAAKKKK